MFQMITNITTLTLICAGVVGDQELPAKADLLDEFTKLQQSAAAARGCRDPAFRKLALQRFDVTEALCREIDRAYSTRYARHAYADGLLGVLAMTRDPNAIPWLEAHCARDPKFAQSLVYHWIRWARLDNGFDLPLRWLPAPDTWFAFFRKLYESSRDEKLRRTILDVMDWYFHDEKAVAFFRELEHSKAATPEVVLLAQRYLQYHGLPLDAGVLCAVMRKLDETGGGRLLLRQAGGLRHEAMVPWLIRHYDDPTLGGEYPPPQLALRMVTLARGIESKEAWREWYAGREHETRADWVRQAMQPLEAVAEESPDKLARVIERETKVWAFDPLVLPYLQKWVAHAELHEVLVRMVYNLRHPALWEAVQPIGDRLVADKRADEVPEFWQLRPLGFGGESRNWEDFVNSVYGTEESYNRRFHNRPG